jgi:D-alanyl-lipoteichoic acid acyltransferase DltB (MBOAT superfamily)
MLFNSIEFLYFIFLFYLFTVFFSKYWKIIFIIFSAIFYSFWNKYFLIFFYFIGFQGYLFSWLITRYRKKSHLYTFISITISILILCFFKYGNYFINDLKKILNSSEESKIVTYILMPVGISFYTFQIISYVIDINNKKVKLPCIKDYLIFFSFFPHLVAGPILKARRFLPQINNGISFNIKNIKKGIILIAWGYFLKSSLADNLSYYVDTNFNNLIGSNSVSILLSIFFFSFQIYGDFAGYSLIAIGICKTFSFHVPANFNVPYLASSFKEFWNRWHISLSTFLKEYVYIPLGGNKKNTMHTYKNIIFTMTIGGLWHGSSLNFFFWGFFQGLFISFEKFFNKICKFKIFKILKILIIFFIITILWVLFRFNNLEDIRLIIFRIIEFNNLDLNQIKMKFLAVKCLTLVLLVLLADILITKKKFIKILKNDFVYGCTLALIIFALITSGEFTGNAFIYFQF